MMQEVPGSSGQPGNDAPDPGPFATPQVPATDPAILRELAEQRAANAYLNQTVQQMGAWIQSDVAQRQEQQRQQQDAYLANLPPQDRALEEARLARAENQQLRQWIAQQVQQPQQRQQPPQRQPQRQAAPQVADRNSAQMTPAQITARMQELVDRTNQHYRLDGEAAITIADIPQDYHESQDLFMVRLKELGEGRKGSAQESDMAKKSAPRPALSGANRPLSPQPVAGVRQVASGDFQAVLSEQKNTTGQRMTPLQRTAKLQQLREDAAAKLPRG